MGVPWYETNLGLEVCQTAPVLGVFVPLANQSPIAIGGISWAPYFATRAAAYAVQRDEFDNFRFEVRSGDIADADVGNNPNTERAEINHNGSLDQTKIINISYLQMVSDGDPINGLNLFALGQLHQVADAGDASGAVPLLMKAGDYSQVTVRSYNAKPTPASPPIVSGFFGASPHRGIWAAYRWRFKYDPVAGFVQIFRNGVAILDWDGGFGYINQNGPSPQLGIYRGTTPETIVVYYSQIEIWYE